VLPFYRAVIGEEIKIGVGCIIGNNTLFLVACYLKVEPFLARKK